MMMIWKRQTDIISVLPASAVLCVSIIASTVLLKQHSCIDVLLGILLAMALDTGMTALERSDARALQRL